MHQVADLKGKLNDVEIALAGSQRLADVSATQPAMVRNWRHVPTLDEIGAVDPTMREYLLGRARAKDALKQAEATYGVQHPQLSVLRKTFEIAEARAATYGDEYRALHPNGISMPEMATNRPGIMGASVESLQAEKVALQSLIDRAEADVSTLSTQRQQIERLNASAEKTKTELGELRRRITGLEIESTAGSRLDIISRGEVPIAPVRDLRMAAAGLGGAAGGLFPLALALLFGLASRRYRFSDDAEGVGRTASLLGVLPEVPRGRSGLTLAADAARCMHQIRVMLQVGLDARGHRVYMTSSASAEAGKTSLTIGLGMSFAAAGFRTLIIDADPMGHGLTRSLGAENAGGMHEVLKGARLQEHVRSARHGLHYLPAGNADTAVAWTVTPSAIRALLAEARKHYDITLIDTGPVLGSVEPTAIAPEVDGIVFVITRGERRPMVEKSVRHLESVGGRMAGVVFNRVSLGDMRHSSYSSSRSSSSTSSSAGRITPVREGDELPVAMGPMMRSVARFMRLEQEQ